ncbi:MAG: hypothetical protein RSJ41_02310 [Clostridia bacterium]
MKKICSWILLLALALTLTACGNNKDPKIAVDPSLMPELDVAETAAPTLDPLADPLAKPDTDWPDPLSDSSDDPLSDSLDDPLADPLGEINPTNDDFNLNLNDDQDAAPTATPVPTASAAPAKDVPVKDYVMVDYTDDALGITLKVPQHWTVESGTNTVTFVEPVSDGKLPMRLAITVKTYSDEKLTNAQQKKEFNGFLNVIKDSYDKFKKGKSTNKLVFMNRSALSCNYMAKQDGANIKGFVIMGNVARTKQIVAMHFSAPQAKFKSSAAFRKTILYSVSPLASADAPATNAPTPKPKSTDAPSA